MTRGDSGTFYSDRRWQDGKKGLREMCDYGAAAFKDGACDALRFDLFNQDERTFVKAHMAEHHPVVPIIITLPKWALDAQPNG